MKSIFFYYLYYIKQFKEFLVGQINLVFFRKLKKSELKITYDNSRNELLKLRENIPVKFNIINKKQEIDLSIIIPVYNSEKTIEKCIDSIVSQDLNMLYEIICINDGSTDNSLNILNNIAKNNNNIKVISQENRGLSGARNTGLNNCIGKYVIFIDSDDFLCEKSLNFYYEKIVNEKADIIVGRIQKYLPKYNVLFALKYNKKEKNIIDICNNTTGTAWGKIFKRELWNDVRFFERYMYEDSIVFLYIFFKAQNIISNRKCLYNFRSSNTSLFKRSKKNYSTLDMLWQIEQMEKRGYFDQLDDLKFQIFLWNLSVMTFERIKVLNDERILESCFIVSRDICLNVKKKNSLKLKFYGKNKKYYSKILKAYENLDYSTWKILCEKILISRKI